jgi:hypothetical protein
MRAAIALRMDYSSKELRGLASRVKSADKHADCWPSRRCWTAAREQTRQWLAGWIVRHLQQRGDAASISTRSPPKSPRRPRHRVA